MAEPRGGSGRPGRGGAREQDDGVWEEAGAAVTVQDAAAAAALAQEAATPFGYRRPARELLAAFGGEDDDTRRRATAALALAGVAADPPLDTAASTAYVHLRVVGARSARRKAARVPVSQRVAARFAPRTPITADRRVAAGALGLGALAAVMVVAIAFRGAAGDRDTAAEALPPDPAPVQTTTAARTTPPADTVASAPMTPPPARPARPRVVRLRVVPTAPAYLCVADGAGTTLWEGMRTGPYVARGKKLVIRVGVATAEITANGRPVKVTTAPGAFELTPAGVRALPGDAPVCGGATAGRPDANGTDAAAGTAATG